MNRLNRKTNTLIELTSSIDFQAMRGVAIDNLAEFTDSELAEVIRNEAQEEVERRNAEWRRKAALSEAEILGEVRKRGCE